MNKNKIWAENLQYDPLWKWFNGLQNITLDLNEVGYNLISKE